MTGPGSAAVEGDRAVDDRSGAASGVGFLPPSAVGEDGLVSGTGTAAGLAVGDATGAPESV
ncbi:hypothetical protein ACIO8H_11720 [Streptomyces sp. NPDC087226]|uniref:hypothetical protein n=1 Tax=Streptomyces sp. NPDC087226 TaxID=3365771 RepID=UPI0038198821